MHLESWTLHLSFMSDWDIDEARRLYNVARWSGGYFDINSHGNLVARPTGRDDGPEIDLYLLTDDIKARGLTLPVLVRFSGILHDRVRQLNEAFTHAMTAAGYRGHFTPVYPIKVNQQRSVIAEILRHENNGVGLEAGSKPELMVVLAQSHTRGVIVCNGYKDREYIRLALIGKQLGHEVYIVVEKLNELDLIVEESRALGVEPLIGVRVRLASLGAGNWQNTGGEKSKFGLSAAELLRVVQRLRDADMLDTLQMMHFHMGSQ
ncbi:MAG: arginine decarboxylase, partial [Acidiferrobacterales bacterium]